MMEFIFSIFGCDVVEIVSIHIYLKMIKEEFHGMLFIWRISLLLLCTVLPSMDEHCKFS